MPRFDFSSPGAAFTGAVTDVLQKQKAEERQRLLDSLQFSADQRAQDAAAREEKESKQRLLYQRLGAALPYLEPGADPSSLDPELVEEGKHIGAFTPRPVPQVSTAITGMKDGQGNPTEDFTPETPKQGPPETRLGYVGNYEQRERDRGRASSGALITALVTSEDPEKRKAGELLAQFAALNGGQLTPELASPYLAPDRPTQIFDQETGKFTAGPAMNPRTEIVNRSYPPIGRADRMPMVVGTVPGTNTPMVIWPGSRAATPLTGVTRGADPDEAPLGIPMRALEKLNDNLSILQVDPETGIVKDAAQLRAFRQSALDVVGSAKVSSTVRNIAMLHVQDPSAAKAMARNSNLSDAEVSDLGQLLQQIGSGEVVEILRRNPAPKFAKPTDSKRTGKY